MNLLYLLGGLAAILTLIIAYTVVLEFYIRGKQDRRLGDRRMVDNRQGERRVNTMEWTGPERRQGDRRNQDRRQGDRRSSQAQPA